MNKENIKYFQRTKNTKASEEYIDVQFDYQGKPVEWAIPIEYRRTGTHFSDSNDLEIQDYVVEVYKKCEPGYWTAWRAEQDKFWLGKPNAKTTKPFFDVLATDFSWKSLKSDLPDNPNWARRIQDLKEFGYTIATRLNYLDRRIGEKCTHLLLLPLPRGGITGYETWSQELRARIVRVLGGIDAYEGRKVNKDGLLPDHKFPEIRWNESVRRPDLSGISDDEIIRDFQLLTNQRNLQKREVCRNCSQTGERGTPFGVSYFYEGGKSWKADIPKRGPEAVKGCVGCGWYDFEKWRSSLNKDIGKN